MTLGIRIRAVALAIVMAALATSVHAAPATTIYVDDDAAAGGNGSAGSPFNNLTDALAATKASVGPVNNMLRYNGVLLPNGRNF